MTRLPLIFLCCASAVHSLECVNCGVFLSASTPECRGKPTNTSCDPENFGCVTITGLNLDNTYYVEKRCATKTEQGAEGCIDITVRGINAKQCFCAGDFCNQSSYAHSAPLVSLLLSLSVLVTHL